jgi:hypothetical protein
MYQIQWLRFWPDLISARAVSNPEFAWRCAFLKRSRL